MSTQLLQIHPKDNVVVALSTFARGSELDFRGEKYTLSAEIPVGHKIALIPIPKGDHVIKYGHPIGRATASIEPGEWVHSHNLVTELAGMDGYNYTPEKAHRIPVRDDLEFEGFVRADGQVGIRNEIWIVPTVGCVNPIVRTLAQRAIPGDNIDDVFALPHPYGCSQVGQDLRTTQKLLAGLVHHPNAGGVLVCGLGCENNSIREFRKVLGDFDRERVLFLAAQEVEDEMETGNHLLRELMHYAGRTKRQTVPVSSLKIGLKCGGSDAFSGITANPLVGRVSDHIVSCGGSAVMTEVPEMFGAEGQLLNRCVDSQVFEKGVSMINTFKAYLLNHDCPITENPSPGNRAGGITTLEEKSLGNTQKSGRSPVSDILNVGERIVHNGLNLLQGPGNDGVAVTLLAATGAQLVLFTTGRGTPLGAPVPTIKIATTHDLALRKSNWIDFDAGGILDGIEPDILSRQLLNLTLDVTSGRIRTHSESFGCRDIALFKNGVTV